MSSSEHWRELGDTSAREVGGAVGGPDREGCPWMATQQPRRRRSVQGVADKLRGVLELGLLIDHTHQGLALCSVGRKT